LITGGEPDVKEVEVELELLLHPDTIKSKNIVSNMLKRKKILFIHGPFLKTENIEIYLLLQAATLNGSKFESD